MGDLENKLHAFLFEYGVPIQQLPGVNQVSKNQLVPIMEGYKKENKNKEFYVCVCTNGHDVTCANCEWFHSGWTIRVQGKNVVLFKEKWEVNISQIPIFKNVLFVVSKRTKMNEFAQNRTDFVCVISNRKKLSRRKKTSETNRRGSRQRNY